MRRMLVCLFLLVCGTGCSSPSVQPTVVAPATAALAATPALAPAPAPAPASPPTAVPTSRPTPVPANTVLPDQGGFAYRWPVYLPEGMQVSPDETRVPEDGQIGQTAPGFYLVTFSNEDGRKKVIIAGGSVEPFPITGSERAVTLDGRSATYILNGEQTMVRFAMPPGQGVQFVYGIGLSEQEVLLVAESLLPIDLTEMRARVGLP